MVNEVDQSFLPQACDECILYELLVYSEWKQEPELVKYSKSTDPNILNVAASSYSIKHVLQYLGRRESISDEILRLLLRHLPWQFAVGESGKVVAILQDVQLEIRTSRDEYCTVVGKAVVPRDPYPQWRRLAWSPDCSMLAVSQSNGSVSFYDLLGSNLFNIYPPKFQQDVPCADIKQAQACIIFINSRIKSPKWSCELLLVNYHAELRGFLVSPTDGYQENHTFSFSQHHRQGIVAVAYHPSHHLLFLAGPSALFSASALKGLGSSMGLSAWRLLNDYPFYRLALSTDEEEALLQAHRSLWNWVPSFRRSRNHSVIFKMQVSPNGRLLACLHSCGSISVWHLPGIRLYKFWSLREQPDYNVRNPLVDRGKTRLTITPDDSEFHPIDINWWSDQAVIIARFCGAVSVCAVANLRNLLGESPEFLAGQPQVSALCNPQGFLSLECESLLTSNKRLVEEDEHWEETSVDESEEDESPLLSQGSAFLQSAVYLVTDMERFQPKRKRLRVLHRTYRLLGLKSTTPEELYSRKIDNEEYDEALSLARAYNLDCDQVYQRQWRNSEVSIDTIHNFLSKITKRSWVLNECVKRVPETFAAAKELLLYGLQVTSLETLVAIGEGTDGGHFVLKSLKEETINQDDTSETDTPGQSLLDKINMESLTESQRDLIRYRRKLLQYLDMLCTYELILGGCHLAPDQYSHRFYAQFRDDPPLLSAVQFARESQPQAVGHLLTYHSDLVLPHWLPMLSNFPETMPPYEYRELLPECDPEGRVFPRPRKRLRNADWCEGAPLPQAMSPAEDGVNVNIDVDLGAIYEDDPSLNQFVMGNLTREAVSSWYSARVSQVESRSCLVDHALALVKLAQERNITGLDILHHQLLLLDTLVYSVNLEHMTLAALQKLSELDKVKLLMSKTTESTFVTDLRQILLPYLTRCDRRSPGSRIRLLREYLVDVSVRDLALPLKLFQALRDEEDDILGSVEEMMNLALLCLYSCPREDQMEQAQMILECVPERGPPGTMSDVLSSLHDKLDDLELDLCAAEILKSNSVPKPLSFIRDFKSNSTTVQQLLTKMARTLGKKLPPPTETEWKQLLEDMLDLQSKVFSSVEVQVVYEIYVSTLLSSGSAANIMATGDILQCREIGDYSKKVPFTRAVALVLQAATEYFDSAGDLLDPAMELARLCLHLISDEHEEIQEKLDLISSLQFLSDFGLTLLPLQVRLCDDRMRLIEACVRNKPKAYRQCVRLLKLAEKLRVAGADSRAREGQVLVLVAETAFQARDYLFCANMCRLLVDKTLVVGWRVARELGQCDEFADLHLRLDLLSFALLHCSSDLIEELVTARCHLEAQLLQDQIVRQVELQNGEPYVSDEEFSDALTSPLSPQKDFLPESTFGDIVGDPAEALKQTTQKLIRNVGNQDFWRNTLSWVKGKESELAKGTPEAEQEPPFTRQGFPAFYDSLLSDYHANELSTQYDRYSSPSKPRPVLQLCQMVLRIALLEECAERGNTSDHSGVLVQLGELLLPEDSPLGLSHLLALWDPTGAEHCFSNLPYSAVSLQLAAYYYALRSSEASEDLFLHPPAKLITHVARLAEESRVGDTHPCWPLLLKYQGLLEDYLQGERLQALGCGVDLQRFTFDSEYQQDTILGLAMTEEDDKFQLAVELGSRHNVSASEIAARHVTSLLLQGGDTARLATKLADSRLNQLLKSDSEQACRRLEENVYPNMDGRDHHSLGLYFTLLDRVAPDSPVHSLLPREHLRLLHKVKATSADIDYKLLVEPNADVLKGLEPVLTKDNIGMVAKLLKSLSHSSVQPGALYGVWAQKEFFQSLGERLTNAECLRLIERCAAHFRKMNAADVVSFVQGTCFSERAAEVMSAGCRRALLIRVVELCEDDALRLRGDQRAQEEWAFGIATLRRWLNHLETISSRSLNDQSSTGSADFQHLYRLLDISRGEPDSVREVMKRAVHSSIPLTSVQLLLTLPPGTPPTLERLLGDLLHEAMASPRSESESVLSAVLRRLQEVASLEQRDASAAVWRQLEPLCGDLSLSPGVRLKALTLVQTLNQSPEDNTTKLLYHHAQALVATGWPDTVITLQESDLATESARYDLFQRLLAHAGSWGHFTTLAQLLREWPDFCEVSPSPWTTFISKLIRQGDLESENVAILLENILEGNVLSAQDVECVVVDCEESVEHSLLLLVCLLPEHPSLHVLAVSLIHSHNTSIEGDLTPRVLALLLNRGLLASLVSTPVYPQLIESALSGDKAPTIDQLVDQLLSAGCEPEASMLRFLHLGVPPSLTTFSATLAALRSK